MTQKKLPYYAIIPARYASTRFPAKVLAEIGGKPLFWHAYMRAFESGLFEKVFVAGDDTRIEAKAQELNVPYIATKKEHPSGTDRVREAMHIIGLPKECVIVNVQGDEPFLTKDMFEAILAPFETGTSQNHCECASLGILLDPIKDSDRIHSPNQVKIVCAQNGEALYFSRSPIPFNRDKDVPPKAPYLGHVGIYAFTRNTLEKMANLSPTPLEETEKLEQLRLLENNIRIQIRLISSAPHGVDTIEDLERAQNYYKKLIMP